MKPHKNDDFDKYAHNMARFRVKCKCGSNVYLSKMHPKRICKFCRNMVYLDKKEEFKERLINQLKK